MFIGVGRFELFIPASGSLKDKRQVLRSVTGTIGHKFNVSIAEVGFQDKWQRATLGVSCVSGTPGQCRKILQEVEKTIAKVSAAQAEIVDRSFDVVGYDDL